MTRMFPINPTIMTIPNTTGTKRLVSMFNSSYQSSVLFSDRPGMLTVTENGDLQRSAALAVVLVYWLETERAGTAGWRTGIIISSNFVIKRNSKSLKIRPFCILLHPYFSTGTLMEHLPPIIYCFLSVFGPWFAAVLRLKMLAKGNPF